ASTLQPCPTGIAALATTFATAGLSRATVQFKGFPRAQTSTRAWLGTRPPPALPRAVASATPALESATARAAAHVATLCFTMNLIRSLLPSGDLPRGGAGRTVRPTPPGRPWA